ncbi:MAG: pantoate--beta-alanine ligase [bacterium]|nr:pantoate--beta-alanine ligase [bacterium]
MKVINKTSEMQKISKKIRRRNISIGFVPTMGALHKGHISLIDIARKHSQFVVVSIFVNPTQFGPKEDFSNYPRTFNKDLDCLFEKKVDIVFAPTINEIYPEEYGTYIDIPDFSNKLCGKSRPTHFKGVCTIVAKLFNIVSPDIAVFGEKDAQQVIILKKMVKDLNFPVKIITGKIIREPSGLAMSSRNKYLTDKQKQNASIIYKTLKETEKKINNGERNIQNLKKFIRNGLLTKMDHPATAENELKIDYIEIINKDNLQQPKTLKGECLIAIAVWCGKTRLIDNITVNFNH